MKKSPTLVFGVIFLTLISLMNTKILQAQTKEAQKIAEKEIGKYVVKCGDSWYVNKITSGPYETRRYGSIALKPRTLSESDVLNGIEYLGVATYSYFGPVRKFGYVDENNMGWSKWSDDNIVFDIWIQKKDGSWKTELTTDMFRGSGYVEISCTDIPSLAGLEKKIREAIDFFKKVPQTQLDGSMRGFDVNKIFDDLRGLAKHLNNGSALNTILNAEKYYKGSYSNYEKAYLGAERILSEYFGIIVESPSATEKINENIENKTDSDTSRPSLEPAKIYTETDLVSALEKAKYIITGGKDYTVRWIDVPSSADRKIILDYIKRGDEALKNADIIAKSLSNKEALEIIAKCDGMLNRDKYDFERGGGGKKGLRDAWRLLSAYLKGK